MAIWSKTTRVGDRLNTTTDPVDVSASVAPTAGQVLTAASATTATWQTIAGGFADNFTWEYIPVATTVTIPVNQAMQLINRTLVVDGTLIIDGSYDSITV